MGIPAGMHTFGPENGTLWVRTGRMGAAAAAGHDLLIQVTDWQATLEVAPDSGRSSVVLEADSTSLRVREGFGGMQPLGDDDKENIRQTIDDDVLRGTRIEFRSTSVDVGEDGVIRAQGDLTLIGAAHPIELELVVDEHGAIGGSVVVKQSEWGIEPYSALFGALKVADEVEITVNASLSGAPPAVEDWSPTWEWRPVALVDPGISSFLWALVFFLYLWLGMAAIDVPLGVAFVLSLVAGLFIFVYVRTRGVGREE
jgi:polyisoprenoid-binding protein YceI